jgi:hypothetical protein
MTRDLAPARPESVPRPPSRTIVSFWLPLALVIAGAALRLWQYAARASLTVDEAALARNIVDRSLRTLLLEPLAFDQTAPPGFLVVEKAAVTLFGNNEYALRLFPLACSILSLVLLWRLANRLLEGAGVSTAIALMALPPGLIFYSCAVKQYSSDVAGSLMLLLLALSLRQGVPTVRQAWRAGAIGAVIVWFSQPAVLTLAGLGVALGALAMLERNKAALRRVGLVASFWVVSGAGAVLASRGITSAATRGYMHAFWSEGFLPLPFHLRASAGWLRDQITLSMLGPQGFAFPQPELYVALAALGFVWLFLRRRDSAVLLAAPVLATVAAAAAQQYPLAGRLTLFLAPSLLLTVAAVVPFFGALAAKPRAIVSGLVAILVVAPVAGALRSAPPAYTYEELTPALSHLAGARRPGDQVYVYFGSAQAFLFYAPRFGFGKDDYVIGGCHRGDSAAYLRELDRFRRSPRLWVVLAHAERRDVQSIGDYLGHIGVVRDSAVTPSRLPYVGSGLGGRVDLYDLSDPERLASSPDPGDHPSRSPAAIVPGRGCERGPAAITQDSLVR